LSDLILTSSFVAHGIQPLPLLRQAARTGAAAEGQSTSTASPRVRWQPSQDRPV
jgi:hypothetical protein